KMNAKAYRRWTNALAAVAVVATLVYDRTGPLQPVVLGLGALSALVGACIYFRFRWSLRLKEGAGAEASEVEEHVAEEAVTGTAVAGWEGYHSAAIARGLLKNTKSTFAPRRFDPHEISALL